MAGTDDAEAALSCAQFRDCIEAFESFPLKSETCGGRSYGAWVTHFHACDDCSDAVLAHRAEQRGVRASDYPCVHMAYRATQVCEQHPDREDCPDLIIDYIAKFDEFQLMKSDVRLTILFCPWCGIKLPQSRRDQWFDAMDALGIDPWQSPDAVPEPYRSDAWFKRAQTPGRS